MNLKTTLLAGLLCLAGIAHAAAVDDGQTGQDLRHGAVQIIEHGNLLTALPGTGVLRCILH